MTDNENYIIKETTELDPEAQISGCVTEEEEDLSEDIPKCERIIESVLFAAGHPVEYVRLADAMNISLDLCKKIVSDYAEKYNNEDELSRGIMMVLFPDACQICTREEYGHYVRQALGIRRGGNLSNSSLEVLALIAYNQPVTRAYIDTVRGVDSSYAVSSMCDKKLIEPCGRLDAPGKPLLYKTTDNFLRVFGLSSLSELPSVTTPDGTVIGAEGLDSDQMTMEIEAEKSEAAE